MEQITNTPREVYNAAHPILVVDATKSLTRNDILSWALTSLKDVCLVEIIGTIHKDGILVPVDTMLAWRCNTNAEQQKYTYDLYNVEPLVYVMDKIHVDLDLASTYVFYDHEVFAGADCQHAPIFALPKGFTLKELCGNISNLERYTEMMRTYGNNIVAMGSSEHPKTDAPNANTGKEDN